MLISFKRALHSSVFCCGNKGFNRFFLEKFNVLHFHAIILIKMRLEWIMHFLNQSVYGHILSHLNYNLLK